MVVKRRRAAGHASGGRGARCAVITVSDTRGANDDGSGDAMTRGLERAGHGVVSRAWVKDQVPAIRRSLRAALARRDVDAVLLTGGTGIAPRDRTPEAILPMLERELPGFGERFRDLSYRQVGGAAWLSRAGAGITNGRLVIWLPGSTGAVELAISKLVGPELAHAIRLLNRPEGGD
jgi:molybdenum cofactor biosynthesis protein B